MASFEAGQDLVSAAEAFYLRHHRADPSRRPPAGLYVAAASRPKGPNPSLRWEGRSVMRKRH